MEELVRGDFLGRTHIGLDYFDASINRIAAWVDRDAQRASRRCSLPCSSPPTALRAAEECRRLHRRGWHCWKNSRHCPFGAVWDEHCRRQNVPVGADVAR